MANVYEKLMKARILLQNSELKKTGHNKFSGFFYFELGDFLPQTQTIFSSLGLCGFIRYGSDYAVLKIVDVEKPEDSIEITSPMAEAALKGMHPIQNLGAVQTYIRRYLWVTAMELVEHDALDATVGKGQRTEDHPLAPKESAVGVAAAVRNDLDEATIRKCEGIAEEIEMLYVSEGVEPAFHLYSSVTENDEKTGVWSYLGSKTRSAIKAYGKEQRDGI